MDHISFCKLFYSSTHIPVNLLCGGTIRYSSLAEELSIHLGNYAVPHHLDFPCFSSNKPDISYGLVKVEEDGSYIVIGPAFSLPVSDEVVRQYMQQTNIDPAMKERIAAYLQAIPLVSRFRFCSILSFVHFCINGKTISIEQLFQESSEDRYDRRSKQTISKAEVSSFYDDQTTQKFEREAYRLIRSGNQARLKEHIDRFPSGLRYGSFADMPLRNAKNMLISIGSKACISGMVPGGVDELEARQLFELYVRECETKQTVDDVYRLGYAMLLDFCHKTAEVQLPMNVSDEVRRCLIYVKSHVYMPISVEDVARCIGRSTSYVMKSVKREVGRTVGDCIMEARLEEAGSLLAYSDMSLSGISYALCFSSQSHFQNAFKKRYGCTPREYRMEEKQKLRI